MRFTPTYQLTYGGTTQTVRQWADLLNIPHSTLLSRLAMGWPVERILTEPLQSRTYEVDINGVALSLQEALKLLGVKRPAIHRAAERHHLTIEQEIQRRFSLLPK